MVNLIMRMLGLGSAVDALDGETSKAYLGAVGLLLSGAASVLGGAANIIMELVPLHGAAAYLTFAEGLKHDPSSAMVLAGIALISKGLGDIGQRHALANLHNTVNAQAQPPVNPPAQPPAQN